MLVSICIPTFSRLNYLKQAVQSALNQTYKNIEICVSQNPKGTIPDRDIQTWCAIEAAKGILLYTSNKENLGLTGNLNVLAAKAKGNYLIFLGDDDLLHPDFVKNLIYAAENSNADIVFCNQYFIDREGVILEKETRELNVLYKRNTLNKGLLPDAVKTIFNNSVPLSASLIKKELFSTYTFNQELNTPEFPFFLRIALNNGKFFYVNRQLAYYRLHNNSETSRGLATEKLLKDVLSINVPDKYIKLKEHFISDNIIPSVNKALLSGNKELAGYFLHSPYYPKKRFLRIIQTILRFLPTKITIAIFSLRKV